MTTPLMWSPSRRVFVRRALINAALTFAVFTLLASFANYAQGAYMVLVLPFVMTLILTLEDFLRWRRVRAEHWEIEESHLIHDGPDGRAMIPLAEIEGVQKRLGGAVLLRLKSRQRILMRYLDAPADIVAALDSARPK